MTEDDPIYQLDTNILIYAVRGGITWNKIKAVCDPLMTEPRPIYSLVSEAELLSFAEQNRWGAAKRQQVAFFLGYFDRVTIDDPKILAAYTLIDAFSRKKGVTMGKNDLWIAATANVYGAVLVTTDRDFEHLHGKYLTRILVS